MPNRPYSTSPSHSQPANARYVHKGLFIASPRYVLYRCPGLLWSLRRPTNGCPSRRIIDASIFSRLCPKIAPNRLFTPLLTANKHCDPLWRKKAYSLRSATLNVGWEYILRFWNDLWHFYRVNKEYQEWRFWLIMCIVHVNDLYGSFKLLMHFITFFCLFYTKLRD